MKKWVFLLFFSFLAGCRPPAQPNFDMPCKFSEEKPAYQCHQPEGFIETFWKQFNDPLLDWLVEEGVSCNFDLLLAKERVCEAKGLYQIEFGKLFPFVDGIGLFSRKRNSETLADSPFLGAKFVNIFEIGFDSTWEIDLFGKIRDGKRAAAYEMMATCDRVFDAQISVISEIARNYVLLRALQKQYQIAQEQLKNDKELVSITLTRYASGLISELDVWRAQAIVDRRKAELPVILIAIKQTIYRIGVLLGRAPEDLLDLLCSPAPIPCADGKIPLCLPCQLLRQRPDIRAAENELEAAGARLLVAKKDLLPSVSLLSSYTWETGSYSNLFKSASQNWFFFPQISIPLFNAGVIRGNILVQSAKQKQAVIFYEKIVMEALEEVEMSLAAYFDETSRYLALEDEVKRNQSAMAIALDQYKAGIESFEVVIDSERDLYNAKSQLIDSQEHLMTALIAVYKSLGGGWPCSCLP